MLELMTSHQINMPEILQNQLLTWPCLQNLQLVMSRFSTSLSEKTHQHKAQEVNYHLKEICANKSINLIDHSKDIKHHHLNKLTLHLTKGGTNILSTTFVREISNIFQ